MQLKHDNKTNINILYYVIPNSFYEMNLGFIFYILHFAIYVMFDY